MFTKIAFNTAHCKCVACVQVRVENGAVVESVLETCFGMALVHFCAIAGSYGRRLIQLTNNRVCIGSSWSIAQPIPDDAVVLPGFKLRRDA